jgi:hypothetical protein
MHPRLQCVTVHAPPFQNRQRAPAFVLKRHLKLYLCHARSFFPYTCVRPRSYFDHRVCSFLPSSTAYVWLLLLRPCRLHQHGGAVRLRAEVQLAGQLTQVSLATLCG